MKNTGLPYPGALSNGIKLRYEAAKAITGVECTAGKTPGGKTQAAGALRTFFTACATALDDLHDTAVPTVSTRTRTNSTTATVVFSEPLDQSVVPALASITIGARVLSAVAVNSSGHLVVTGVDITGGDTITYTKPAVNALRDRAGNQVATFTGALA